VVAHAVSFSRYGGPDVLELVETAIPAPGTGEVVVRVVAAGLNPVETSIREGRFEHEWPARFPAGQGSDFAGFIHAVGSGASPWKPGDEVMGHTVRGSQADFVVVPAGHIIRKPERLTWEVAGSLYIAAANAWAAVQDANPQPGQTVLVHAAAGGVGGIAAQLARLRGATVIGTASPEHFDHLRQIGVIPVEYGPGLRERLARAAPGGIDAELNHLGDDALANVPPTDTADRTVLQKVAALVADRQITVPVAAIYPLGRCGTPTANSRPDTPTARSCWAWTRSPTRGRRCAASTSGRARRSGTSRAAHRRRPPTKRSRRSSATRTTRPRLRPAAAPTRTSPGNTPGGIRWSP
jgi:hypothetical protein